MSDPKSLLDDMAALGAEMFQDILTSRTREIQRYLIIASAILLLVSVGVYSVQELKIGPAALVSGKSGWVTTFGIVAVAYYLVLYLAATWMDFSRHSFLHWEKAQRAKHLFGEASEHFRDVQRRFKTMVEVADSHSQFLETHGLNADDSIYKSQQKKLQEQMDSDLAMGQAKNGLLRDITRAHVWNRRLTIALELLVPCALAGLALGTAMRTANWNW